MKGWFLPALRKTRGGSQHAGVGHVKQYAIPVVFLAECDCTVGALLIFRISSRPITVGFD